MKAEKHFILRHDMSIDLQGRTLYRIEALQDLDIHSVKKGDFGGYVEKEANLGENAWVFGNAKVFGEAEVYGYAVVGGDAEVYGDAKVFGAAKVFGNAMVYGNAKLYGNAEVYGSAQVYGNSRVFDVAEVFDNTDVYGNARVFGGSLVYGAAQVFGDAKVFGGAYVYGNSKVYGDAEISGDVWVGGDSRVPCDVIKSTDDCINIMNTRYIVTLTPKFINIGCQLHPKEEWWGYTDKDILKMDGKPGLMWWRKWKPALQAICSSTAGTEEQSAQCINKDKKGE